MTLSKRRTENSRVENAEIMFSVLFLKPINVGNNVGMFSLLTILSIISEFRIRHLTPDPDYPPLLREK